VSYGRILSISAAESTILFHHQHFYPSLPVTVLHIKLSSVPSRIVMSLEYPRNVWNALLDCFILKINIKFQSLSLVLFIFYLFNLMSLLTNICSLPTSVYLLKFFYYKKSL